MPDTDLVLDLVLASDAAVQALRIRDVVRVYMIAKNRYSMLRLCTYECIRRCVVLRRKQPTDLAMQIEGLLGAVHPRIITAVLGAAAGAGCVKKVVRAVDGILGQAVGVGVVEALPVLWRYTRHQGRADALAASRGYAR